MLYLLRHGLTDWNKENRLQGQSDIPLNDQGIEQAKKAKEEYQNVHFDICFVSPLIRAYQTAEIMLAGRNIPIIVDKRLQEMSFGAYEGTYDYRDPANPISIIFNHPEEYKKSLGGAESFEELYARAASFLKEKVYPLLAIDKDVLLVGHGAMNSCIYAICKDLPIRDFWQNGINNCQLYEVGGKDGIKGNNVKKAQY